MSRDLSRRDNLREDFVGNVMSLDLFSFVVGGFIGSGTFRDVYYYRPDTNCVLKVETGAQSFTNIQEWRIWEYYKKRPLGKLLAPCLDISPCGVYLLQAHATDIVGPELPTEVPALFTDMTPTNWGIYKKRVVCRDYANMTFMKNADTTTMRKADWRWKRTKVEE